MYDACITVGTSVCGCSFWFAPCEGVQRMIQVYAIRAQPPSQCCTGSWRDRLSAAPALYELPQPSRTDVMHPAKQGGSMGAQFSRCSLLVFVPSHVHICASCLRLQSYNTKPRKIPFQSLTDRTEVRLPGYKPSYYPLTFLGSSTSWHGPSIT